MMMMMIIRTTTPTITKSAGVIHICSQVQGKMANYSILRYLENEWLKVHSSTCQPYLYCICEIVICCIFLPAVMLNLSDLYSFITTCVAVFWNTCSLLRFVFGRSYMRESCHNPGFKWQIQGLHYLWQVCYKCMSDVVSDRMHYICILYRYSSKSPFMLFFCEFVWILLQASRHVFTAADTQTDIDQVPVPARIKAESLVPEAGISSKCIPFLF